MVSINPGGPRDHPPRDPCALASGWFSQLRSWKSRSSGGRPQIEADLRALIRRIGVENPLWGVPRIHGELLKLGLRSPNQASPSIWSSGVDRRARNGEPSGVTTRLDSLKTNGFRRLRTSRVEIIRGPRKRSILLRLQKWSCVVCQKIVGHIQCPPAPLWGAFVVRRERSENAS